MNCLEFRRAVGADPQALTPEMNRHKSECAACARYYNDMTRLDDLVGRALQIDLSALARPKKLHAYWATAASFIAAFALTLFLWFSTATPVTATELVAHARGEPDSLIQTQQNANADDIKKIMEKSGVRLRNNVGLVSYAQSCWFRGHFVPHLVVQTPQGPVTVLLLPQEQRVKQAQHFHEDGFDGLILPAPRGDIVVLSTQSAASLQTVADTVLAAVEYE